VALSKIRAGMGDVEAPAVEVWSDEDEARATGLLQVLAPDGRAVGPLPALEPALLRELHRAMLRSRVLGEKMLLLQRQGRIGFFAESRGQEAAVVGGAAALEARDFIVPAHRELGAALWRGLPVAKIVAQLYGNANDIGRGRQMPAHPAAPRALNFIPPSSCVATQLPHAAGLAWAAKMRRDPVVVLAYLGEGATSAEDFHSGVNFAAVYRVPAVFLCENNQWAISTPASRQTASKTFAIKALAYGMPGVRVDGNDVLAVHAAVSEAASRARAGGGPMLIEAVTYRMGAHSSSDDPHAYRSEADEAAWADKDPLRRFGAYLAATGLLDAAGVAAQRAEIEAEIAAVVAAEERVGPPPLRSLIEHVYARAPAALEEQLAELDRVRAERPPK
jgi:pyruvate dehydrogenase E1 component alpha subunit/2-oxoisovalerate dehydrogenase E1 component alpha subunit